MLTGQLSHPAGAVEPSGLDFRRHAWFLRLGGLGYSRTPVVVLAPTGRAMARARMLISTRVEAALSDQLGAFAATVLSGDRSGLNAKTLQDLRQTNLAHLLAGVFYLALSGGNIATERALLWLLWGLVPCCLTNVP